MVDTSKKLKLYQYQYSIRQRIFVARHLENGNLIVVKRSRANMRIDSKKIKICTRLNHPHILPLLDWWNDKQKIKNNLPAKEKVECTSYTLTPYIQGFSLQQYLQTNGPMPLKQALAVLLAITSALEYAQRQDKNLGFTPLSPSKILIEEHSLKVLIKNIGMYQALIDLRPGYFGEKYDRPNVRKFTYISREEILQGANYGAVTSIYYLASLFYHMITGIPPLARRIENYHLLSPVELIQKISQNQMQPIKAILPKIPQEIALLLEQSLSDESSQRANSYYEFYNQLQRLGNYLPDLCGDI